MSSAQNIQDEPSVQPSTQDSLGAQVVNFGCRLNIAEGEAIRAAALGAGDVTIINSCAVTAEAERQVRQAIRRAARQRPGVPIHVTGCAAETSRSVLAAMPEVTRLVSNTLKTRAGIFATPALATAPALAPTTSSGLRKIPGENPGFAPVVSGSGHARAFIAVQNGCDHRCTFCIIPQGRGDSRSARLEDVAQAVQIATERGHNEVVLTGVDLTSYGQDLAGQPTLGDLVAHILERVAGLARLRLSSVDSVEIDPLLFEILTTEPRMMPHLHLSLQSGDDMILKRMKRRHSRFDAVRLVERLKKARPEITIGADMIAGFPTEDERMFANSLALIDDCDIVFGHIFPYSPRDRTPAARMPQVERSTARARAAVLRRACTRRLDSLMETMVGSRARMLVENDGMSGYGENYIRLLLDEPARAGALLDVTIGDAKGNAYAKENAEQATTGALAP